MSENKKNSSRKIILRNLIGAVISVFALIFVIQVLLGIRTRHGEEIDVPDFYGLSVEEASALASSTGVRLDITDSVYVASIDRGSVFSQNPSAGDKVKEGRRILITINAIHPQMVDMPLLTGLSLRGAQTEILSKGLKVGHLSYVTDIATNYVLEQRYRGRLVRSGTRVEAGSKIDLVLGENPDDGGTAIPLLTGLTLDFASERLFENSLNLHGVKYDRSVKNASDSARALVYSQSPAASSASFPLGTEVDLYLTVDSAKFVAAAKSASVDSSAALTL